MIGYEENQSLSEIIIFKPTENGSFKLLITTILCLIISILCLVYIYLKLRLNKYIKIILCLMGIYGIIALIVMIASNTIMLVQNTKTTISCTFLAKSVLILLWSNGSFTSLISILRWEKTEKWKHCFFYNYEYRKKGLT